MCLNISRPPPDISILRNRHRALTKLSQIFINGNRSSKDKSLDKPFSDEKGLTRRNENVDAISALPRDK